MSVKHNIKAVVEQILEDVTVGKISWNLEEAVEATPDVAKLVPRLILYQVVLLLSINEKLGVVNHE